jgi:MoxR-like ATPase
MGDRAFLARRIGECVATSRRVGTAVQSLAATLARIQDNVGTVVEGKPEVIRHALTALLAEGHLLIEDVPGVGKTLLAKAIGRSIACSVRRVQFTPDLLPSDITGVTVFNQEHGDFEFKPGAVFANIVLGDEINRAGPKTQSALLEAMEEHTVTVDGTTYELGVPFMVIATQNPIELEGTYPLPEAQRDRFMVRLSIGYPSVEAELEVLEVHGGGDRVGTLEPVTDAQEVAAMIETVKTIHAADALKRYVVDIVRTTREHPAVELDASPRASLALLRASRAKAAGEGRDYVLPDDLKVLAPALLSHRLILTPEAQMSERTPADVLSEILDTLPVPGKR